MKIVVNGKGIEIEKAFPLQVKDWKALESLGLDLNDLKPNAETTANLVHYLCNKANPDITMDDIDEMTLDDMNEISERFQKASDGKERVDPSG